MASLGFVRNNRWVQQDRMRINSIDSPDLNPGLSELKPAIPESKPAGTQEPKPAGIPEPKPRFKFPLDPSPNVIENGKEDESGENSDESSARDLDYGPGIVSRLRLKFIQLAEHAANQADKENEAFFNSKKRRYGSVDDLLESCRPSIPKIVPRTPQPQKSQPFIPSGLQSKEYSKSSTSLFTGSLFTPLQPVITNDVKPPIPAKPAQKSPPDEPTGPNEEFSPAETLASLRRKFEAPKPELTSRHKPEKTGETESFLATKTVASLENSRRRIFSDEQKAADKQQESELEFMKISRKLRKVPDIIEKDMPNNKPMPVERIISQDSTYDQFTEVSTMPDYSRNPPDPDIRSSPFRNNFLTNTNQNTPHQSHHDIMKLNDHSPPPEEPLPPPLEPPPPLPHVFKRPSMTSDVDSTSDVDPLSDRKCNNNNNNNNSSLLMKFDALTNDIESGGPIMRSKAPTNVGHVIQRNSSVENGDSNGFNELQQMLEKFDQKRSAEKDTELRFEADIGLTEGFVERPPLLELETESWKTESRPSNTTQNEVLLDFSEPTINFPPQQTQTLISNEDQLIDFANFNSNSSKETVIYEPTITLEPLSSTNFVDSRICDEESTSSNSSDDGETKGEYNPNEQNIHMESEIRNGFDSLMPKELPCLSSGLVAGDGNPVSNSILSLVSDEDLASLLEPDSHDVQFIFEGEHGIVPGKSNISLHKKEEKNNLDFHPINVHTKAYAYLEEEAVNAESWEMGVELNHNQYIDLKNEINNAFLAKRIEQVERELRAARNVNTPPGLINSLEGGKNEGGLVSYVPSHLSSTDYQLGSGGDSTSMSNMNSSWNYSNSSDEITSHMQSFDVREEESGNSFSKNGQEDLLF